MNVTREAKMLAMEVKLVPIEEVYANDYKGRAVGYIDLNNNNSIETEFSKGDFVETMKHFVANYEF